MGSRILRRLTIFYKAKYIHILTVHRLQWKHHRKVGRLIRIGQVSQSSLQLCARRWETCGHIPWARRNWQRVNGLTRRNWQRINGLHLNMWRMVANDWQSSVILHLCLPLLYLLCLQKNSSKWRFRIRRKHTKMATYPKRTDCSNSTQRRRVLWYKLHDLGP